MMTRKNYTGLVGVYRVLSELLTRRIYGSPVIVDDGCDILLNDGKRIQVRTKHVFSTGNCSYFRFAFKLEENCDFFVLWGITPKSNYFYIVPRKDILGKTSLNIKLRNTLSGLEYLDKWEYLK